MGLGVRKNTTLIIYFVEEERLLSSQIVTQPVIAKSIFLTTKQLGGIDHPPVLQVLREDLELRAI